VGAAISVGGSGYDGWTSLGLTSVNLFLQHFSTLVDQVQVDHCAIKRRGAHLRHEASLERCRRLGKNVARATQLPFEEWTYVGEEAGVSCPVCHCNIIYVEKDLPRSCAPSARCTAL